MAGPSNGGRGATPSATARSQATKESTATPGTVDHARKTLCELEFIHCNDIGETREIAEEVLITALRQITGELNKLEKNKNAAKAIRAIATLWKERAFDNAGKAIIERVEQRLKEITSVPVNEELTNISNKAATETVRLQEKGKEVLGAIEKAQERLISEVSGRIAASQATTQNATNLQVRTYAGAATAGGNGTPLASTQGSQNRNP